MAAGIPACLAPLLPVRIKPAPLPQREVEGWWRASEGRGGERVSPLLQAGVEIIPLEPDQCSDLRREAPQCHTYLSPLPPLFGGWGRSRNC